MSFPKWISQLSCYIIFLTKQKSIKKRKRQSKREINTNENNGNKMKRPFLLPRKTNREKGPLEARDKQEQQRGRKQGKTKQNSRKRATPQHSTRTYVAFPGTRANKDTRRQMTVGYNASIYRAARCGPFVYYHLSGLAHPYPRSRGVFRSISQEETINLHIFGKYLICTPFLLRRVGCRVRGKKRSRLLAVQPLVCWGCWTTLMWRSRFYILFGLPHVVITG